MVLVKQIFCRPGEALSIPGSWGSKISRQSAHEGSKVVRPRHRPPLPPGNIPGTHFFYVLSQPQGHSTAERILSLKKIQWSHRNRTPDLPACSAVPHSTGLPRVPCKSEGRKYFCNRGSKFSRRSKFRLRSSQSRHRAVWALTSREAADLLSVILQITKFYWTMNCIKSQSQLKGNTLNVH